MNEDIQRILIAKICGRKTYDELSFMRKLWLHFCTHNESPNPEMDMLPDYLNDLNAIVPQVRKLNEEKRIKVLTYLDAIHAPYGVVSSLDTMATATSTPAQWSEAFIRAHGLWEETIE
jgi:hypothetical protein